MTLEMISPAETAKVTWMSPDRGLWVASEKGTFRGMIERSEGEYIATDALGTPVGTFDSLGGGQTALDDESLQASAPVDNPVLVNAIAASSAVAALCLAATIFTLAV